MKNHTTGQLADMLKIHPETVRRYTSRFSSFMSPNAQPGGKRTRLYNEDDLKVIALISDMKAHRKTFEDIQVALEAGQSDSIQIPEDLPEQNLISIEQQERIIARMQELEEALEELRTENIQLKEQVKLQRELGKLEGEAKLNAELASLNQQIGKLEGKLEALEGRE